MVRLQLLGVAELTGRADPTRSAPAVMQPKRLAVLAYLAAAEPAGFHRRDVLHALFWPKLDAPAAQRALRQAVHYLRQQLGPDVLVGRGADQVGLDPGRCTSDVAELRAALAERRHEDALALARGPFLHGFHADGAAGEFDEWVERTRASLQRGALGAALALADEAEGLARLDRAAGYLRRATELAPDDESVVRRLMATLARAGDHGGALRTYERYAAWLRTEFGAAPSAETQRLAGGLAIVDARPAVQSPGGAAPPPDPAPPSVAARLLPPAGPARPPATALAASGVSPARSGRRSVVAAAVAAVLAAMAAFVAGDPAPERHPPPGAGRTAAGVPELPGVALAPVDGDAGAPGAVLAGAAAEQIIRARIARVVEVAPAATVEPTATPAERAAAFRRAAHAAGASVVVTLVVVPVRDSLRVTARVVDARSGAVRGATEPVLVAAGAPTAGLEPLRQRLLAAVAIAVDPGVSMWQHATAPTSYDAYRLSVDAGARFIRGDYRGALAPNLRANQLDTAFSLALVGAAMASVNLDEWARADSLIGVLDRRRALLTPGEHRTLAWLQARLRGDRLAAYVLSRGGGGLFPGTFADIQEGLEAVVVNRPADAIRVLARIDPERADVRGWAPYWRRLTEAHHLTGDHESELAAARRAHRVLGAPRLWTLQLEARALVALGRTSEVAAVLDRALAMPPEDGLTAGEVLVTTAAELRAHGRAGEAGPVLARALGWFDAHPAAPDGRAVGLRAHAGALLLADRPAEARRLLRLLPGDSGASWHRGLMGLAAARSGDQVAARRAAATLARDPRPYQFGRTLYWAGAVRGALGDTGAAVATLREAFARGQPYGAYLHVAPEWDALRGHAAFEQLIRPAP